MSIFIDHRSGQQPPVTKKHISIDWCVHPKISENLMDTWYMVFNKPPCNKKGGAFIFLWKLWDEFILGHHVNYFNIGDFQGVGRGSAKTEIMLGSVIPDI